MLEQLIAHCEQFVICFANEIHLDLTLDVREDQADITLAMT